MDYLTLIYALVDPRDDVVRYVGRTTDPYGRMRAHLGDRDHEGAAKQRWTAALHELGIEPRMVVLQAVEHADAPDAERCWISRYALEHKLFNDPAELGWLPVPEPSVEPATVRYVPAPQSW